MGYSKGLRAEHKLRVRMAMSMAAPFDLEDATLYEINEAMRKAYGKTFDKKYLTTLRDEVLDELALIVEQLSTSEGAMELIRESQERSEMFEAMADIIS
jgi:hypothetical protein